MKINRAGSSEIFDIYSDIMQKYLTKKAGKATEVGEALFKELFPSATKISFDSSQQLLEVFTKVTEGKSLPAIGRKLRFIGEQLSNNGPKLTDPNWIDTSEDFIQEAVMNCEDVLDAIKGISINDTESAKLVAYMQRVVSKEGPDQVALLEVASRRLKTIGPPKVEPSVTPKVEPPVAPKAELPIAPKAEPPIAPKVQSPAQPAAGIRGRGVPVAPKPKPLQEGELGARIRQNSAPKVAVTKAKVEQATGVAMPAKAVESLDNSVEIAARLGAMEASIAELSTAAARSGEETKRAIQPVIESLKQESAESAQKLQSIADEVAQIHTDKAKIAKGLSDEQAKAVKKMVEKETKSLATASKKAGAEESSRLLKNTEIAQNFSAAVQKGVVGKFLLGVAGPLALKGLGIAAVLGLLAWGGISLWDYLSNPDNKDDLQTYQTSVSDLGKAIAAARAAHGTLRFNQRTYGNEQNIDVLDELKDNEESASILMEPKDPAAMIIAAKQTEELKAEITEFLTNQEALRGDLASLDGFQETIQADQQLLSALEHWRQVVIDIYPAAESAISAGAGSANIGAATGPIAESRPGASTGASTDLGSGSDNPIILDVYGEKIDISNKPPGFRSAAFRIASDLLQTPLGMAFMDPDNRWGGFIRKTGNPQIDYLNSLGYLYKEGVFNRSQLRKFIRHSLPKQGRRRHSGWKNAINYYRNNPVSQKVAENLLLSQSFIKESTNRLNIGMRKMADQYPNKYISDAISGLSDQYSKLYYAGLKSMYNQKRENVKADYSDLYDVHKEKGADLIHEAHPNAIVVSDAMGNGGLVENLLEQKSHSEGVAKSAPTGNFRGKHADLAVIDALIKIANQADNDGLFEVSKMIDSTIESILN